MLPLQCLFAFANLLRALVETRRAGGKVRQEHVASLGSISLPPTVAGRMDIWARIHQRIAGFAGEGKTVGVEGRVHARRDWGRVNCDARRCGAELVM